MPNAGVDDFGSLQQDQAVCDRFSSFGAPESFHKRGSFGISAVSVFPCTRDRTLKHALRFVGLSRVGSRLCVTDVSLAIRQMPICLILSLFQALSSFRT